ncbi:SpoIIIAH-like family protein [Acetonema longum]|uniref:Stage III sporulation protein AH n=1 Tax=Acetonema longum DSM 6540 TaxID=1009370 RepID=F7NJX7_9FIRM|nr:SpoIIIAH-like family protein [Acetonema longum]EGO63624.1 hypothetical protein ALO_11934 [Acetonema longum DSM 6540]
MLVIALKKIRMALIAIGIVVLGILLFQLVTSYQNRLPSKVDRTNAMEVTKPIVTEQAVIAIPDFFTEYRLERDKIRSERFDLLKDMMKTAQNEDAKQKAQDAIMKLVLEKQREYEMENMIKARGFQDALVLVQDNSVNAVIKTASFSREDVLQVADVIRRVTGVKSEDITISAKP